MADLGQEPVSANQRPPKMDIAKYTNIAMGCTLSGMNR